ncbi:MAG: serine hydrolase [Candidatus Sericytochromatia bacterium]
MKKFLLAFIIILFSYTNQAYAEESKNMDLIDKTYHNLFFEENIENKFDPSFLKVIKYSDIKNILNSIKKDSGKYLGYKLLSDKEIELDFEKATIQSAINFSAENKINGIWFGEVNLKKIDLNEVIETIKKLEGINSITIRKNGKNFINHNSNLPLGVGSAFKLFILKELYNRVEKGQESLSKVVYLDKNKFSLPGGFLHSWPDKTPITLATLANLMISQSDNTATDFLVDYLGRDNIEKLAPESTKPLFKTLEMFKIKGLLKKEEIENFLSKNLKDKKIFLKEIEKLDKNKINFPETPYFIDKIEWLISTEELCKIIESLGENNALSINNSGLIKNNWNFVGFKGGSEPGVVNLTYLLKKGSDTYSLSFTLNNSKRSIKNDEFINLISKTISGLYLSE